MRYRVFCDDTLIHDTYIPDASMHLIEPSCKLGDNIAGSFEFKVAPSNPGYNIIKRLISTIAVVEDNEIIWTGRVVSESEDFWKRRSFTCEGALAYLNDTYTAISTYQEITMYNFLRLLLNNHNDKVSRDDHSFTIGVITMEDPDSNYEYTTDNESTWDTISKTFIDRLGGHIRIRYGQYNSNSMHLNCKPIFDYYDDYPNTSSQEINFGINLLEFTKEWDMSGIATVILPRGKQLEDEDENGQKQYVTIKSVNDGDEYLKNISAYNYYGRIEKIVDFNDVEDPATLKKMATAYIRGMQFDNMTLSVSAVDLHHLDTSIRKFSVLDLVHCISKPHGLDKIFPITEKEIDINSPSNTKYTLGSSNSKSLSGVSSASSSSTKDKIDALNDSPDVLAAAKKQASDILNSYTHGYINIVQENDISQALIISSMSKYTDEHAKLWKFDMNGLGYSPGVNAHGFREYTLAITRNGTIVADFIKTGNLSDGAGKNWWNLQTGEFQLQYNTKIIQGSKNDPNNPAVEKGTVQDVYDLAQVASDDADAAINTANATKNKLDKQTVGGKNYLDGTNDWNGWGRYGKGDGQNLNFSFSGETATCKKPTHLNVSYFIQSPKKNITYSSVRGAEYTLHFEARSADNWGQKTATNKIVVKFILKKCTKNGNNETWADIAAFTKEFALTTAWVRRATTVTFVDSSFTKVYKTGIKYTDCYLCIEFFNVSLHEVSVRHMKLERGNVITDWCVSQNDQSRTATVKANKALKDSKDYVNAISDKDREFTKAQRKALDDSLTQAKVLKRLTKNGAAKGIYLKNNQLYINGTYIKSGTLDAGIVKAGILTNNKQTFYWNLATGYVKSKNMELSNMNATGTVQTTSGGKRVQVKDGSFNVYSKVNNKWICSGYIHGGTLTDASKKYPKSIIVHGLDALVLSTSRLYTYDRFDKNHSEGISDNIVFEYTTPAGTTGTLELRVRNGIMVGYEINYGGSSAQGAVRQIIPSRTYWS